MAFSLTNVKRINFKRHEALVFQSYIVTVNGSECRRKLGGEDASTLRLPHKENESFA